MKHVILITGASSGFGALGARALARAGHTVYASMRETAGRNAPHVAEARKYAADQGVDLRTVEPADAIVRVVGLPFGTRPFRTTVDPSRDGAEIVNGVADRVRAELLRRIGLEDLLTPQVSTGAWAGGA